LEPTEEKEKERFTPLEIITLAYFKCLAITKHCSLIQLTHCCLLLALRCRKCGLTKDHPHHVNWHPGPAAYRHHNIIICARVLASRSIGVIFVRAFVILQQRVKSQPTVKDFSHLMIVQSSSFFPSSFFPFSFINS
jgi:hypothetical protein